MTPRHSLLERPISLAGDPTHAAFLLGFAWLDDTDIGEIPFFLPCYCFSVLLRPPSRTISPFSLCGGRSPPHPRLSILSEKDRMALPQSYRPDPASAITANRSPLPLLPLADVTSGSYNMLDDVAIIEGSLLSPDLDFEIRNQMLRSAPFAAVVAYSASSGHLASSTPVLQPCFYGSRRVEGVVFLFSRRIINVRSLSSSDPSSSMAAISQPLGEQENAVTALNLHTSIHSAARNSPRLLSAEPASSSLYLPIGVCAFICTAKLSRLHLRLRQNSTSAIGLLISSFCTIEPTSSPSAAFGFHRLLYTIGSPYPFSAHLTSTTTAALRALARKHLELPKFFCLRQCSRSSPSSSHLSILAATAQTDPPVPPKSSTRTLYSSSPLCCFLPCLAHYCTLLFFCSVFSLLRYPCGQNAACVPFSFRTCNSRSKICLCLLPCY
ncbi:hypothetical protein BHE74_00033148 [Ensete ventricosum]|nr:hypothetical protein BHE74_00033148 [Ensete ventricosum]